MAFIKSQDIIKENIYLLNKQNKEMKLTLQGICNDPENLNQFKIFKLAKIMDFKYLKTIF